MLQGVARAACAYGVIRHDRCYAGVAAGAEDSEGVDGLHPDSRVGLAFGPGPDLDSDLEVKRVQESFEPSAAAPPHGADSGAEDIPTLEPVVPDR
jgi:hypothetical protein